MKPLHLIRPAPLPSPLVRRLPNEADWQYSKRCACLVALGSRWVRHPSYTFDPRHSTNAEVWKPAFAAAWAEVHRRAEADRNRNPAYQRAQRMRDAVGGDA